MGHNYHMPDPVRTELQRLPQCMAVFYYRDGEYQFLLCTDHFCQVLGLNRESWKAEPVFFTTLGRMAGTTRSRKVFFEETLEGLPVRWSDDSLDGDSHIIAPADKCCAVLVFSDEEGLLQISGNWCSFEPLSRADHLLSAEEIVSLFVKAGCRNPEPEACWFLHRDGNAATATLAWRVENSYLNAVDGSWLQTGK